MNNLIKKSSKVKEENYWIVFIKNEIPAFSFFNYIFINHTFKNLTSNELQVIKQHEIAHVKQYHTFDILFIELVGILFWFNPMVNYLMKSLKEVHEYIVDEMIAGHGESKRAYAQLLLDLASDTKVFDFAASFAGDHIKNRILMIAKPRTSPIYKLSFAILVPISAILLLSFSWIKNPKATSKMQTNISNSHLNLKKYCGVYFPLKKYCTFLKPVEVILKGDKLFIASGSITDELNFEADSIFTYTGNSARSIAFNLDSKKRVTGCALLKLVTKEQRNYLAMEGEYSKR
jgi:hypothetical protein